MQLPISDQQAGLASRSPAIANDGRVSIVIPTYNYAHFLDQALDSVMAQTVAPAQVIVVDDGSTDDPGAVVARYPGVEFISTPNQGLPAARNVGLVQVSSQYVWFLDADDLLAPDAIEQGLECMAANPGAGFVYGAWVRINKAQVPEGGPILRPMGASAHVRLYRRNCIGVPATVMYDREKLLECGGFDSELRSCEDYDLYLRMTKLYPVAYYWHPVARYRLHGGNMSNDVAKMLKWHLHVLHKNRPPPDALREEIRKWRAGLRAATADYAMRAWYERSPSKELRWRNRIYMMKVSPLDSARAVLRSLALRMMPERMKTLIKSLLRKYLSEDD